MTPEERVVLVARAAARWFANKAAGNALNGMYADIGIARELRAALEAYDHEHQEAEAVPQRQAR